MSDKLIEQTMIVSDEQLKEEKALTTISDILRKEVLKEFESTITMNTWYKFKSNIYIQPSPNIPNTHRINYNITYDKIPDYSISLCHTIDSKETILVPEKSFWKRFKNAIKYLFQGGNGKC